MFVWPESFRVLKSSSVDTPSDRKIVPKVRGLSMNGRERERKKRIWIIWQSQSRISKSGKLWRSSFDLITKRKGRLKRTGLVWALGRWPVYSLQALNHEAYEKEIQRNTYKGIHLMQFLIFQIFSPSSHTHRFRCWRWTSTQRHLARAIDAK